MYIKQRGFTLLEWVIVLVILGITGSVTVSSLSKVRQVQQFNAAVENIQGELISAQNQAIRDSEQITVIFETTPGSVLLETQDSNGSTIRNLELADQINLNAQGFNPSTGLSFSFKGTSSNPGAFASITHKNNTNLNSCIGIANILGRVYLGEVSGVNCNE